jgi:heavy metal translocating P-type ATPase
MNALSHDQVATPKAEGASDREEPGQSRLRGAFALTALGTAPYRTHFEYKVVHSVPGRIRLKAKNLYFDFPQASACLVRLSTQPGITGIRCDSWSASAIIEYSTELWSEDELLSCLDTITYGYGPDEAPKTVMPVLKEAAPVRFLRSVLPLLERILPAACQLGLGAAAFASALLGMPLPMTHIILIASTVPIAVRATRTLLEEGKIGIDALDGIAASLMIANGKLLEAGFMTTLIATGEFIREKTSRRCEKMVTDLLGLCGRSAWLIRGKKRICVSADEVKVGETVVVYPGDMVPVDGLVISGEAAVDQAKLTGESIPVEVKAGANVFASTVVVEGKIYIRCQAVGSQTRAGLVLQCVSSAPLHETKIQNYASSVADKAIMPIFLAAGLCFAVTRDVSRLMSMLILDFCTGIRIAAPTAVLSSMHRAGRRGILIKSGGALERLASVTAIVFDKTGTLTSGEPVVEDVSRFNGRTEDEVLALAAAVEMRLQHPAARAIVKAAQQKGLTIPERAESEFKRSMGCKATVENHEVIVGSKNMMTSEGIAIDETKESEARATKLGESVAYVAIDGKVAGLIRYSDRLRPEVKQAMKELRRLGVKKLVMATGDTEEAAKRIAACCGITDVIARAFPEDKAELVQRLKSEGHTVAVIGDGINDSPALAYADVAISLHGATDAAQHSADIILTDDDLSRLPEAVRIARSAMDLVKQNLALAVVPNSAGFGMAALGLLGPAGATVVNNGCAIAAGLNSLRPLYSNSWSKAEPIADQTDAVK